MKRGVTMIDFGDLLSYATTIGYHWNQAHDILVKDKVPPMYEISTRELYIGEGKDYGWSEDTIKIVDGFMQKHNLTECILTGD